MKEKAEHLQKLREHESRNISTENNLSLHQLVAAMKQVHVISKSHQYPRTHIHSKSEYEKILLSQFQH